MSCLFIALSEFTPKGDDPAILRQKICNFLALNRKLAYATAADYIQWEVSVDLDSYITHMRRQQSWGGAIEIQTFCELYSYCVECYNLRDSGRTIQFRPRSGVCVKTCKISWNGVHFVAV
jgi:hypothetical protein